MAAKAQTPKVYFVKRRTFIITVILLVLLILCLIIVAVVLYVTKTTGDNHPITMITSTPATSQNTNETSPVGAPDPNAGFRLPANIKPLEYFIELQPHTMEPVPTDTFSGYVQIQFLCTNTTDVITLHGSRLFLRSSTIQLELNSSSLAGSTSLPAIVNYRQDNVRDFIMFDLNRPLVLGVTYKLSMNYTGALAKNLMGLYKSKYQYKNETRHIIVSQLAPTQARSAFPCFDEPAMKAHFVVCLVRKPYMSSLSNMELKLTYQRENDYQADIFERSLLMSTYLVTFVIHDFTHKSNWTKQGVKISVYSRPDAIHQTEHALHVAREVLPFYQEFFDADYPLPKLDMMAVPDFSAGAMENWGLVLYRERNMLFDPQNSPESVKYRVTVLVAHELAHQWFGNLVSPAWWDDIWLNEGFATFIEYLGCDYLYPEWGMYENFIKNALHTVMNIDSFHTSSPVFRSISIPSEIYQMFDAVSYLKGASLIRMLEFIIGKKTFKAGMARYIRTLKYGVASHDDLWLALSQQVEAEGRSLDIKEIMDTWIKQMNYPVLNVTTNVGDGSIQITQHRFIVSRKPGLNDDVQYKWDVPVTYTNNKEKNFNDNSHVMFHTTENTKVIKNALAGKEDVNAWVVVNLQQKGYYRVNYDLRNWEALIRQLNTNHRSIHVINRAQIISDAWILARADMLDTSVALRTMDYIKHETHFLPFMTESSQMKYMKDMLIRSSLYGLFQKQQRLSVAKRYTNVSWDSTGKMHSQIMMDKDIIIRACYYRFTACTDKVTKIFSQWMQNPDNNLIDRDHQTHVYCTAIRNGGVAEWEFVLSRYLSRETNDDKAALLYSLACTRVPWLLSRLLEMVTLQQDIRFQDCVMVLVAVAKNPIGTDTVWNYVVSHIDSILEKTVGQMFVMTKLFRGITTYYNTQPDLDKFQRLIDDHPQLPHDFTVFNEVVQRIQNNIKFMIANNEAIADWLRKNT